MNSHQKFILMVLALGIIVIILKENPSETIKALIAGAAVGYAFASK